MRAISSSSNFKLQVPNFKTQFSNFTLALSASLFSLLLFPAPAPAQAPAAASGAEALLAQADEVLQEMSKITGLPVKGPLKKRVLSRTEIREFLEEALEAEYTPEQIYKEEAQLKAFGLVSREFDLKEFLLAFYTEQAAGAYDPRLKTMVIADWPEAQMQAMVLAHELTHALQDQNFDLTEFMRAERGNDDATAARQALMEGHATAAMMQRTLGSVPISALPSLQTMMEGVIHQQFTEFPAFTKAPYFFRVQAMFPYIQGMGFVQRALQVKGGWENLGTIFNRPPKLTKEIIDPKLYFEGAAPPPIALPRPPALEGFPGLRRVSENSFGQLGYSSLLGQFISAAEAKNIAPNWLADRFIVYENRPAGRFALVARTRWSGPEQALAFFRDYHTILTKKFPELTPEPHSSPDRFIGTAAGGNVVLIRKGDECLWAEGVPADKTDAMLKWLGSL